MSSRLVFALTKVDNERKIKQVNPFCIISFSPPNKLCWRKEFLMELKKIKKGNELVMLSNLMRINRTCRVLPWFLLSSIVSGGVQGRSGT